ncbi:MAG TPA: SpoIIE family protein phosphatase [Bryobacteraceae bacterium]|jgi:serine phosphatase RsbU (regulator of sigma subunit)/pSer/pThr/pTyr-binding forkhead associated (FHA) protein|nr:SpoIIE family protein phosphatase [Bryobacteraceae bacterium]
MDSATLDLVPSASVIVVDPSGHRSRVELAPLPFKIGRQADNDLILRDSRASRIHARIFQESGEYKIEDAGSRHGVYVNGKRVESQALRSSDRIEFGFPDSYQLIFALDGAELNRLIDQFGAHEKSGPMGSSAGPGANLAKLRAILDVARTLQTGLSLQDVLNSVVDAALAITGAERGFLLLRSGGELETRVARDRKGATLPSSDLRVPRRVIKRALEQRRDLLSMNFDPQGTGEFRPERSVVDLELRSVISVPLVRLSKVRGDATNVLSTAEETAGVLYMDSRLATADLAGGNRELLQTLAIEASTILENARLLDEERIKQKIEEELDVARTIQQGLLPRSLPSDGWFRACGSSVASHQVGGDYFDVIPSGPDAWTAVVADVSGKGVSSALLASLLQGAFLAVSHGDKALDKRLERINVFLNERTSGEKYATVFYCLLERSGRLYYVNAGHCPPLIVRHAGSIESLAATAMPVGLVESAQFEVSETALADGDKIVIYTDGVTEAQNLQGEFFGRHKLRQVITEHHADSCQALHEAVQSAVAAFTESAPQADDITLVVFEYSWDR